MNDYGMSKIPDYYRGRVSNPPRICPPSRLHSREDLERQTAEVIARAQVKSTSSSPSDPAVAPNPSAMKTQEKRSPSSSGTLLGDAAL